ncbi:unnamed protein product [Caenorhabditis nigoni]
MNPATVAMIATLVPDPEAKCRALRKLKEDNEELHEEAMEKLRKSQQEYESSAKKREDEANERIKSQREENQKITEMLSEEIKKQNTKYDDEVEKMNKEHSSRIKNMRTETEEKRKQAEQDHKIKMSRMEKEHKKQTTQAEKVLADAKEEGRQKVVEAEKEKDGIIQKRNEELQVFLNAAKELEDCHRENIREIREKNSAFRQGNMEIRRNQLEIENKVKMDKMNENYKDLMRELTNQNARNVIQEFRRIIETVITVTNSLESILHDCLPSHGGAPTIVPGRLDVDFSNIQSAMNSFRNEKRLFSQYVLNTNLTDRRLFETCTAYIKDMNGLMTSQDLSEMCSQLPLRLSKESANAEDLRIIKFYGELSTTLHQLFLELCTKLDDSTRNMQIEHVSGAEGRSPQAINQMSNYSGRTLGRISRNETGEAPIPDGKKRAFLELKETVLRIVDSLQNINTLCNPMIGGQPHVNPGANSNDISRLVTDRELLRNQINSFRKLVDDNSDNFGPHLNFLTQLDGILQGQVLPTICQELQNVIDAGDTENVKKYGEFSQDVLQQVNRFIGTLEWESNGRIQKRNEELQNSAFRQKNMIIRRKQLQIEDRVKMDKINENCEDIMRSLTTENARNVIEEFRKIIKSVITVSSSLGSIRSDCLPSHGGAPTIVPGKLDVDFSNIESATNSFRYAKYLFSQYVSNTKLTERELFETCTDLIRDMNELMTAEDLSETCSQLPLALENETPSTEDLRIIKFYGERSRELHKLFLKLCETLDDSTKTMQLEHLPTASGHSKQSK